MVWAYTFSLPDDPLRATLDRSHFDGIYLGNRKMPFISEDFRSLMLEIWNVKYLQMPRFRELISSIPIEIRLEHFLNDGDSPDIPIPPCRSATSTRSAISSPTTLAKGWYKL